MNNSYDFKEGSTESLENKNFNNKKKMNIHFISTSSDHRVMNLDEDTTVDELLKSFLKRIGKNDYKKDFSPHNGVKLKFGDETKIKQFFSFRREATIS